MNDIKDNKHFIHVYINKADFPMCCMVWVLYFCVLPEDTGQSAMGTGTYLLSGAVPEELPKWFSTFCVESTTKCQLKEPGVKAELPND